MIARRFLLRLLIATLIAYASTHSIAAQDDPTPEVTPDTPANFERLAVEVLDEFPHDTSAFTQGLLLHDGFLYESAGLYGQSNLRRTDPSTGEILQIVDVPDEYFAEGLALVDDRLLQITWREETALVYDLETFEQIDEFSYSGEGWGLCYDGELLYMSDGSPVIDIRDPETFEALDNYVVTFDEQPVPMINELECVGESIYANVWQTDFIIRFDKTTGIIDGIIDATTLLTEEERAELQGGAVLNGIAYNPDTDTFLITGKLWDRIFEVRFVPFEGESDS